MKPILFFTILLGLFGSSAFAQEPATLVTGFYELAINQHQPRAAAERYIGDRYTQHNPSIPDGKQAFVDFFEERIRRFPKLHAEIKRVISEGDLVVLHVHSKPTPEERGRAIIDIFRVEAGKIVEHWDVIQEVPQTSANDNGMF